MPAAEYTVTVKVLGTVMGHEQQVLQYLQQHLLTDHVTLVNATNRDHAALTLQFHRMKSRLPADELAAVLAASAGVQYFSWSCICDCLCFNQRIASTYILLT